MNKMTFDTDLDDDLRPEYDFTQMQVIKRGPGRVKADEPLIKLAPDVAAVFPDEQSVNEALRVLIRIARTEINFLPIVNNP